MTETPQYAGQDIESYHSTEPGSSREHLATKSTDNVTFIKVE